MTTADIVAMPVSERLKLMETLWDSLCGQAAGPQIPRWHDDVLQERLKRLASGDDTTSSWSEARERIRAQAKAG